MRKAYILAEVFITLCIIGAIATILLPSLIKGTSRSEVKPSPKEHHQRVEKSVKYDYDFTK